MIRILWFDEWGDYDACDISLRSSFGALSPADRHALWAIWLHDHPEVQEEQWRRDDTDTERQRERLDLKKDSIRAIALYDGRENHRRYWKPLAACLNWDTALCLTCCHLNSELVASKDRYVSTLPDWGGGGWICLPQEEPPRPLRRPQNSPLALHTPRSCNLPRAAVGEE